MDGNAHGFLPGDYQAGGGRLHSKTMLIDRDTEKATVLTGSFNWSSSATVANDETFVVLKGERVTREHIEYFESLWDNGKTIAFDSVNEIGEENKVLHSRCGNFDINDPLLDVNHIFDNGYPCDADSGFVPGSIIFNEIHWDGYNHQVDYSDFALDMVNNDEYIELLNTTDQPIDMSFWTISTNTDFSVGFYPGTIIGPGERFLILDHNLEPFVDVVPQDVRHAFDQGDFVINTANDPRFLRLNLRNSDSFLQILDPQGRVLDVVGD